MKEFNLKEFFKDQDNYYLLYILFLFSYVTYLLVQWPIFAGDTDLWYHLSGGRYILEHGAIPKDSSFFSFITPSREYVDYYWLFQVLVYKIHSLAGYYGLVFLRATAFLTLMFFVYVYLRKRLVDSKPSIYAALFFSFYLIVLITRYQVVRPHIFSYLFIAIFLYVLEFKREKIVFLPIIAIFWTNIHGIEYPVMFLIIFAYLIEYAFYRVKDKQTLNRKEIAVWIGLIISIAAVYITPLGTKLTWMPFVPTGFASLYINELKHLQLNELISYSVADLSLTVPTTFNLLVLFSCFSVLACFFRKSVRISHIILFLGGIILLAKARRFTVECLLLSLPVVSTYLSCLLIPNLISKKSRLYIKPISVIAIAFVFFIPFFTIIKYFGIMPKYPFSQRDLPYGCAVFLNKTGVNGTVLNNPNHGGFLQWALYPKFKIYMNMQVPHLFSDEDIYLLSKALSQSNVLKSLIQRYQPGFITVSLINKNFKNLIKSFPQYKLVFFDDVEALYADKNTYPKIVEKYQLNYLDPFMITSIDIDKLMAKKTYDSEELAELSRMLDVYPDCGLKNQIFAVILNKKGEYHKAIPYADRLIDNFPDAYAGYKLRAASLKGMEQYDKAILEYEKVLKRTKDQLEIYSEIGSIYMKQEKYSKAYKTLSEVIDPFAGSTDYKSFYNLCLAAIKSGNRKDAQILIRYANVLVPPEDKEWNEKYARLAEMIKEGGKTEGR